MMVRNIVRAVEQYKASREEAEAYLAIVYLTIPAHTWLLANITAVIL